MSYITISNYSTAATAGDGRWYAQTSVTAPSGYFVVSGSWNYDTLSTATEVTPYRDAHRGFSGGSGALPTQYEVGLGANASGTLYVYAVCDLIP